MYFQPNSCDTHAEREWAQGTFLRQQRKVPPAHAQRVFHVDAILLIGSPWQIIQDLNNLRNIIR